MFVGQAVVLDTGYSKKIVGRSRGIDEQLADQLLNLAPSPSVLVSHLKGCLEFSCLRSDRIVLSRTVFGRQQSGKGIEQGAISRFIVTDSRNLAGFGNNPALFAAHILSEGLLHFPGQVAANLGDIRLPQSGISRLCDSLPTVPASESARVLRAVQIHRNVALIGMSDALVFLAGLLLHFAEERRCRTSISIGAMFSESRSFDLLVYPEFNNRIKRKLVTSQIRTISVCEEPVLVRWENNQYVFPTPISKK